MVEIKIFRHKKLDHDKSLPISPQAPTSTEATNNPTMQKLGARASFSKSETKSFFPFSIEHLVILVPGLYNANNPSRKKLLLQITSAYSGHLR